MEKVYNRIMRKFQEFLHWLGIPKQLAVDYKVHQVCKIISEFSLEFRTTRDRVQQTIAKKKEAKERNKSRAKLHELMKMHGKSKEEKEVDDLSKMLKSDADGSIPRRKKKHRHREEGDRRCHKEDAEKREHRRKKEDGENPEDDAKKEHRRRREDGERRNNRRVRGEVAGEERLKEKTRDQLVEEYGLKKEFSRETSDISLPPTSPTGQEEEVKVVRRRRRREEIPPSSFTDEIPHPGREEQKSRSHKRRDEAVSPINGVSEEPVTDPEEGRRLKRETRRRSQKSQMRPNVTEQDVVLADGQRVAESEVDSGLFESLMSTAADLGMGTLRRNKERRRSTKLRKSADLMRSRTRENNVYEEEAL